MPDNVIRLDAHRPPGQQPRVDALVYSVAEVAELLNLALGGTYALVRSGDIPARKLGGRWVIPKQAFHDWLEDVTVEPDPEPGPLLPGQGGLF
ncbi:helix-turn-helix domain-containing protein [Jiangella sp. DSM 45060]|uniref:helix-turn-helix domain-containing protein n=1 Tax=Jiangella sp. DSM 45060 TaxID=1798224 RepID=UPI00087AF2B4|nr:helix-turn-helix domain-containing protein [Jiangella sp. DSM 45060]SDT70686.1 DNA binding domain-containing protein, excisionase family [Jiangella sp. DSM 45060]